MSERTPARKLGRRVPWAAIAGVALGVVIVLAVLRFAPREKVTTPAKPEPGKLAGAVLVEDAGRLDEVLFHYVPRLEGLLARPYKDFLGTLDPSVRLVAVVPHDGGAQALHAFLARIDPALDARTRVVETNGPISAWSKDRALVLGPAKAADRTGLLIPAPPDPKWIERANDWRTLASVAQAMPERFYVNELPLEFDAGDFAVTGARVLIDVNLFVKNRGRGIASADAMRELVGKLLGREVVMLGAEDGDVPRHHMSMYMAPLGAEPGHAGVVLVGDPKAAIPIVGADYVPGEPSADSGDPLRGDFSDAMVARFERAAKDLAAAGYRVVRVPTVAFDDKTYFAYTNGVYETRGGAKIAWVPEYADPSLPDAAKLATLDAAARKIYEDLGWTVRPVAVRGVYPYHGTIGCLANVLARTP